MATSFVDRRSGAGARGEALPEREEFPAEVRGVAGAVLEVVGEVPVGDASVTDVVPASTKSAIHTNNRDIAG